MIKPFKGDFRISQVFGANPDMYARFGYKGHNGIDFALPTGTEVIAPHSGKVIEAALDSDGYGWYLKIENDIEGSVLGHNKELLVKVGDEVVEGQKIAISNNSGYSTGPHLHHGYYLKPRDRANGYGGFIDQMALYKTIPVETPVSITEEQKRILDFIGTRTEGDVREAFGALADLPNMNKKISDLESFQDNLEKRVLELEGQIKTNVEVEALSKEQIESLTNEKQKLSELVDTYKPYKGWYEAKLEEIKTLPTVDKFTAVQLISIGVKKLWTERKQKNETTKSN